MRIELVVLLFAVLSANGATQIVGRVLDPQGRIVVGATVRLQTGTSNATVAVTDGQGEFRLDSVTPGFYRLTAKPRDSRAVLKISASLATSRD